MTKNHRIGVLALPGLLLLAGATAALAFPLTSPAETTDVYTVGKGMTEPRRLTAANPVYPDAARKENVQGKVVLDVIVDEKGSVSDLKVLESADERLSAAAIDAVKQWTYAPAKLKSKPVKVRMTVTVAFRLS